MVQQTRGFTLVELMIVVAIIGIITAIAIPLYRDYVDTSRDAALLQSIDTMRVFQEDFRLRNGAYATGRWPDPDSGNATDGLNDTIGWAPPLDGAAASTTYIVTLSSGGYNVQATDGSTGHQVNICIGC